MARYLGDSVLVLHVLSGIYWKGASVIPMDWSPKFRYIAAA